jgi:adenylosuccinate lyase
MLVKLYKNGDKDKEVLASTEQVSELLAKGYTKEPVKSSTKKMEPKIEPAKEEVPQMEEDSSKKRSYVKKSTSDSTGK